MDIRLTKNNQIFHRIDSQIGALLIAALPSVFECVEAPAPNPHVANAASNKMPNVATPQWGAGLSATGYPTITLQTGRTELFYSGPPAGAVENFKRSGFDLPENVRRDYQSLYSRKVLGPQD
jgi:hypothetical protein